MDAIRESRVEQVLNNEWTNKTNKISRAPLHQVWPLVRNIPEKELKNLLDQGYHIKRGSWDNKEDKRLKKNWNRICRCHPEFADPFIAFGVQHRPYDKESAYKIPNAVEMRDLRRKFAMFGMIFRMAYGLEDRLLCDIYSRCKRIFAYKQFAHTTLRQMPLELRELAYEELSDNNEPCSWISYKYNISPSVVKSIKRPHAVKRFTWSPEDDFVLQMTIKAQFPKTDAFEVPTYKIDWFTIAKEMKVSGYDLSQSQLAKRWRKLNPKMVGLRKTGAPYGD